MFNEGYAASSGDSVLRVDVSAEAIRLTRSLVDLLPGEDEVRVAAGPDAAHRRPPAGPGARRARRTARRAGPRPVEQGRDHRGRAPCSRHRTRRGGPYAVQARISLCHDAAARPEDTDWESIGQLYTLLPPTPVTELNRAVAVSMTHGPAAALAMVEDLWPTTSPATTSTPRRRPTSRRGSVGSTRLRRRSGSRSTSPPPARSDGCSASGSTPSAARADRQAPTRGVAH